MLIDADKCWLMLVDADWYWCSNKVQPGFLLAERTFRASAVIFDKYLFTGSGFSDYGSVLSNIYWRSSIPHVESWCFGLPAEGEPSISFIVDFNRTFSRDAKSGRSGRYICAIFFQLVLIFGLCTQKNVPAPVLLALVSTGAVSTYSIIFSAIGTFY